MATTRTNRVEVQITASDEASPTIERLERKIDGLEADEARITVTANTQRLQQQLDTAKAKMEGLDGDEATVQARLIGRLEEDLEQAQTLFNQLDGKTGTVRIEANAQDAISDLDRVDTKLRDIDGRTATARVDVAGEGGLGDLGATAVGGLGAGVLAQQLLSASDLAIQVATVARLSGATHEQAARIVGLFKAQGIEVSDLVGLLTQVNDALNQTPELREQLGVKDTTDLIDQLVQTVEGLSRLDPFQAAALGSQTLGEQGVLQVGLIEAAYGDLRTAIASTPPITKEEDLERMQEMNRTAGDIRSQFERAKQEAAAIAIPGISRALATGDSNQGLFVSTVGLLQGIIDRAVGGSSLPTGSFVGGQAPQGAQGPQGPQSQFFPYRSHIPPGGYPQITIVNPPGTPPATVDNVNQWSRLNGAR